MPEAKFQIKRKCEVCGNTFIAKTLDSRYCCRHCADIAYKKRKADKAKEERLNQIAQIIPGERDFISVKEAVAMYAISRDTLYRLIRKGKLPYINIGERLTRISREQLEKIVPLREEPIKDEHMLPRLYDMEPENCYTIGEISKKFRIDGSTVWAHIRKYSIPTRQIGNYVYAPKKEIDNLYKSL